MIRITSTLSDIIHNNKPLLRFRLSKDTLSSSLGATMTTDSWDTDKKAQAESEYSTCQSLWALKFSFSKCLVELLTLPSFQVSIWVITKFRTGICVFIWKQLWWTAWNRRSKHKVLNSSLACLWFGQHASLSSAYSSFLWRLPHRPCYFQWRGLLLGQKSPGSMWQISHLQSAVVCSLPTPHWSLKRQLNKSSWLWRPALHSYMQGLSKRRKLSAWLWRQLRRITWIFK